jgi:hypothetical protein
MQTPADLLVFKNFDSDGTVVRGECSSIVIIKLGSSSLLTIEYFPVPQARPMQPSPSDQKLVD